MSLHVMVGESSVQMGIGVQKQQYSVWEGEGGVELKDYVWELGGD